MKINMLWENMKYWDNWHFQAKWRAIIVAIMAVVLVIAAIIHNVTQPKSTESTTNIQQSSEVRHDSKESTP